MVANGNIKFDLEISECNSVKQGRREQLCLRAVARAQSCVWASVSGQYVVCQGCVSTVVLKTAEIHIEEEIGSTFGRFGLKTMGHSLETTKTK